MHEQRHMLTPSTNPTVIIVSTHQTQADSSSSATSVSAAVVTAAVVVSPSVVVSAAVISAAVVSSAVISAVVSTCAPDGVNRNSRIQKEYM